MKNIVLFLVDEYKTERITLDELCNELTKLKSKNLNPHLIDSILMDYVDIRTQLEILSFEKNKI